MYQLKKNFSGPITLICKNPPSVNIVTGQIIKDNVEHSISKAIILPQAVKRDADYHRIFVAAGPNFTRGAERDDISQIVIIDFSSLPKGYVPNTTDSFVLDGAPLNISTFHVFKDAKAVMFKLMGVVGNTP